MTLLVLPTETVGVRNPMKGLRGTNSTEWKNVSEYNTPVRWYIPWNAIE